MRNQTFWPNKMRINHGSYMTLAKNVQFSQKRKHCCSSQKQIPIFLRKTIKTLILKIFNHWKAHFALKGPPTARNPRTDPSETVRDFQNFVGPGQVRGMDIFLVWLYRLVLVRQLGFDCSWFQKTRFHFCSISRKSVIPTQLAQINLHLESDFSITSFFTSIRDAHTGYTGSTEYEEYPTPGARILARSTAIFISKEIGVRRVRKFVWASLTST